MKTKNVSLAAIAMLLIGFLSVFTAYAQQNTSCDTSAFSMGPLAVEGDNSAPADRTYLNLGYAFEVSFTPTAAGGQVKVIKFNEAMQIGFLRDWIAEGASGLGAQIRSGLGDSCSHSLGPTLSQVTGYTPPILAIQQAATERKCSSVDLPCGLPETTCTGGSPGKAPNCSLPSCDWGGCHGGGCSGGELPQAPVCTTTTKMCRAEQKVDIYSASIDVRFRLNTGLAGSVPNQQVEIALVETKNDVKTSQGEVTKLLDGINLTNSLLGANKAKYEEGINGYVNNVIKVLSSGVSAFPIPSADYVYLPEVRDSSDIGWASPSVSPPGAAPFVITVKRDTALPETLACRVINCLRKSKEEGTLLVKSCSIS